MDLHPPLLLRIIFANFDFIGVNIFSHRVARAFLPALFGHLDEKVDFFWCDN